MNDTVALGRHCLFCFLCQKLLDLAVVRDIVFSVILYFKRWKKHCACTMDIDSLHCEPHCRHEVFAL